MTTRTVIAELIGTNYPGATPGELADFLRGYYEDEGANVDRVDWLFVATTLIGVGE